MIALIQRVSEARIELGEHDRQTIAAIGRGLLALIGVERNDSESEASRLLRRLLGYRVFGDGDGKMNLSVVDVAGSVLLVPQFTLAADTRKGMRPGFSPAATPEQGRYLFDFFVTQARSRYPRIACGQFGADMQVGLVNDGPVTFWIQASPTRSE